MNNRGACGKIVFVQKMDSMTRVQLVDRALYILIRTNILDKGKNPTIPSVYG